MIAWGNYELELKYISKVSLYHAKGKLSPQGNIIVFPLLLIGISLNLIQFKTLYRVSTVLSLHMVRRALE